MPDDRDAAEYDEASYVPDVAANDRPEDIIREAVESVWTGEPPETRSEFFAQCREAAIAILRGLHQAGQVDALTPTTGKQEPTLLLAGILGEVIGSNNPALTAHCAAFAFDLGIIAESETAIGKRFGVTRATVSYICRMLVETYRDGRPSPAMKSIQAVKRYSGLRKGKCAKQPAAPWEFADAFKTSFQAYQNSNT